MKTPEQNSFGEVAKTFLDYENTVRGDIRYQVVRHNLEAFLADSPLQAIDIQGGSGTDSAWLAGKGHQVLMLESDPVQVGFAGERFTGLAPEVQARILPVDERDVPEVGYLDAFDVALSHMVAPYKKDPLRYLRQVGLVVKPGGITSLLVKSLRGGYLRAKNDGASAAELDRLRKEQRIKNNLGADVYAFRPTQLEHLLETNGFEILGKFGVRSLRRDQDTRKLNEVSKAELAKIILDEIKFSSDPLHINSGQMLHYIAKKRIP